MNNQSVIHQRLNSLKGKKAGDILYFGFHVAKGKLKSIAKPAKLKKIAKLFYSKNGLEIGGPSPFFTKKGFLPIYNQAESIDGVNFSSNTVWSGKIKKGAGYSADGKVIGKQFVSDATNLGSIPNSSYDFVLSCNNIEHIANPLLAIEKMISKLKNGGLLLVIVPRKESNFDHNREVVKFSHLLNDYKNKAPEDDLTHLAEIIVYHDLRLDLPAGNEQAFRRRGIKNLENRCLHQHVFDLPLLKEIFNYFKLEIIETVKLHGDYVIVGRKNKNEK